MLSQQVEKDVKKLSSPPLPNWGGLTSLGFPYLVPPREPTLREPMAEAHNRARAQLHEVQTDARLPGKRERQ